MRLLLKLIVFVGIIYGGYVLYQKTGEHSPVRKWVHDRALTVEVFLAGGEKEVVKELRAELKVQREMLNDVNRQVKQMECSAPVCSATGQRVMVVIKDDPRADIRAEIKHLQEKIWSINALSLKRSRK